MEKEFKYTQNWFSEDGLDILIEESKKYKNGINLLEIGSYEGRSTIWFLENVLYSSNSKITCVDPWLDFSQDENSLTSYALPNAEWKLDIPRYNFLNNILIYDKLNKVEILQGFSHEILPKLISSKNEYDIIFIDGNHTSSFVLTDAILSYYLLKSGGLMIFDDYFWGMKKTETLRPKIAIDSFVSNFKNYIEVLHVGYRYIIRKLC